MVRYTSVGRALLGMGLWVAIVATANFSFLPTHDRLFGLDVGVALEYTLLLSASVIFLALLVINPGAADGVADGATPEPALERVGCDCGDVGECPRCADSYPDDDDDGEGEDSDDDDEPGEDALAAHAAGVVNPTLPEGYAARVLMVNDRLRGRLDDTLSAPDRGPDLTTHGMASPVPSQVFQDAHSAVVAAVRAYQEAQARREESAAIAALRRKGYSDAEITRLSTILGQAIAEQQAEQARKRDDVVKQ